jgi:transglutaminase-like putative cysteine protease
MKMRVGFEMLYDFPQPTPMIMVLGTHFTRASDVIVPDFPHPTRRGDHPYRDMFGNWCSRMVAPASRMRLAADGVVRDSGLLRSGVCFAAVQHAVEDLPADTLVYLLGSRVIARPTGFRKSPGNCFAEHGAGLGAGSGDLRFRPPSRIGFRLRHARATRTAWEAYEEGKGVCRDYAHLAVAFCRCMNIPARYCTGYLSDIGTPKPWAVGDFAGWFEAYIGGHWRTFDPRNNVPRIGRVLIAQGRDASDVPITQTFGPNTLVSFKVWTDEIA